MNTEDSKDTGYDNNPNNKKIRYLIIIRIRE